MHCVGILENQVIPFENTAAYILPVVRLRTKPHCKINVLRGRQARQIIKSHAAIDACCKVLNVERSRESHFGNAIRKGIKRCQTSSINRRVDDHG